MATVLIISSDRMIGGLLGQLADLTGHAAQFRGESEEPTEAVRRGSPDVVLLDAAYGRDVIDGVAAAADHVGAPVVYFAPALGPAELRRLAVERRSKYFPLPAGPRLLSRVLSAALAERRATSSVDELVVAQYGVTAALVAVSRAKMLVERSAATRAESRSLRNDREVALANCRRSYANLREAVIAYTRALRNDGVPPDRTLELVKRTLRGEIDGARPMADADHEIDDAVEWCLQAYYAA
jgi:DNA-binding response OmpR family regulator